MKVHAPAAPRSADPPSPFVTLAELQPGEMEVFRVGAWSSEGKGPRKKFTTGDLDAWIASTAQTGQPTIVIGDHDDHVIAGPVAGLRRVRGSLIAQRGDVPKFAEDVIRAGLVDATSIQLTPGDRAVDHVCLLWKRTPVVPGMAPISARFAGLAPVSRFAMRFDDGECCGGATDLDIAAMSDPAPPMPVEIVPPAAAPIDLAAEIQTEDANAWARRVFDKARAKIQSWWPQTAADAAAFPTVAADVLNQAATLVAKPASGSPNPPDDDDDGDVLAGTYSMEGSTVTPKELTDLIQSAVTASTAPLQAKLDALDGEVKKFATTATTLTASEAKARAAEHEKAATRFAHTLLQQGVVDAPAARAFQAIHAHLAGQVVKFAIEPDGEPKEIDAAELLEVAAGQRPAILKFGKAVSEHAAASTAHGTRLSQEERIAHAQALQDQYHARGIDLPFATFVEKVHAGERAA